MSRSVTVSQLKAQLSALLRKVEAGEDVTVTRRDKPVARLVAAPSGPVDRASGDWCWPGVFDPAVCAPMTEAEMRREGWR